MYGAYIRAARERAGWTREQLARTIGVSESMVGKIERDVTAITLSRLERMADALNQPVGDLLPSSGGSRVSDEFMPVLAAISGVSGVARSDIINALAVNARVLANPYRRQQELTTPLRPESGSMRLPHEPNVMRTDEAAVVVPYEHEDEDQDAERRHEQPEEGRSKGRKAR